MRRKVRNYDFYSRYSHYVPGVADMFILLAWLLLGSLLGNVITLIFTFAMGAEVGTDYAMVVAYPVMFIPAMLYAAVKSRNNSLYTSGVEVDSNNFGKVGGLSVALLAMVSTVAMSYLSEPVSSLLPDPPAWLEDMLNSMTQGNFLMNFICVSIFAPLFEEWLCRGMVLRGLLGKGMKPVWAIIVSAAFFAVIHLNPWQAIPAFLLGCLFGYFYYRTGSLKITMLMHFTNNTMALILSNVAGLETVDGWKDIIPGAAYWVLFAALLLLVALVIRQLGKIELKSPKGNMDEVPALFTE